MTVGSERRGRAAVCRKTHAERGEKTAGRPGAGQCQEDFQVTRTRLDGMRAAVTAQPASNQVSRPAWASARGWQVRVRPPPHFTFLPYPPSGRVAIGSGDVAGALGIRSVVSDELPPPHRRAPSVLTVKSYNARATSNRGRTAIRCHLRQRRASCAGHLPPRGGQKPTTECVRTTTIRPFSKI